MGTSNGWTVPYGAWRCVIALAVVCVVLIQAPAPSAAQVGCCYCDNCPPEVGATCTDLMNSSASCVDLCIVQRGCGVLEFSPQETCDQGCGSKPPFMSPTPTSTPTQTVTQTPTTSPTPSLTATPLDTPTPVFCCQGDGLRCGISSPSNLSMCLANETPVRDAACLAGQCRTFTPTFTRTNTPTVTNTRTNTPTPTSTNTATFTPTIYMGNLLNCDRITTSKKSSQETPVTVTDAQGTRSRKILKPKYLCSPGAFENGTATDPHILYTCYKAKDDPKLPGRGPIDIRNEFEDPTPIPVSVIKGELLCIPSYQLPTPTKPPTATPKP